MPVKLFSLSFLLLTLAAFIGPAGPALSAGTAEPYALTLDFAPEGETSALEAGFRRRLKLTGLFALAEAGASGAGLTMRGQASGDGVSVVLMDAASGRRLIEGVYRPFQDLKDEWLDNFCNKALEAVSGRAGVFGSRIIFVTGEKSKKAIMEIDFGHDEPRVVEDIKNVFESQPTLGPEGQAAWIRRNGSVWELVRDGQVVSAGELHLSPAFKPDGTLVAAVSEENETSLYEFAGQSRRKLLQGRAIAVSPSFSPDGGQLAYVGAQNDLARIYIYSAASGVSRMLSPSMGRMTDPAWSPDGGDIAFVSEETDICVIKADGTGLRQLTKDQGVNMKPAFSPDGRLIVFASDRNGQSELFVMTAEGENQSPLLPALEVSQHQPFWGPQRRYNLIY
ncbi:MAG: hypothetical protein LBS31_10115 [Candidatus Adiutrix sp.]|nr:hypothetical protein [Candidatus Adiutrix sp.]